MESKHTIFDVIRRNDIGKMRQLLKDGIDLNERVSFRMHLEDFFNIDNLEHPENYRYICKLLFLLAKKDVENYSELLQSLDIQFDITPLMFAVMKGTVSLINLLLLSQVNCLNYEVDSATLIMYDGLYKIGKREEPVEITLINGGYCELSPGIKVGLNVLSFAMLTDNNDIAVILLNNGMNIGLKDLFGRTSLHLAASNGNPKVVALLLNRGSIDINAKDITIRTALHNAVICNHWEVVQQLVDAGAEIDAVDEENMTSLHYCAQLGHERIAKLLLSMRADPNILDINGRAPLYHSTLHDHRYITFLLLEHGANRRDAAKNGWLPRGKSMFQVLC